MKKLILFIVVLLMLFGGVFNVSAQQNPQQEDVIIGGFQLAGDRTSELLATPLSIKPGDCGALPPPSFEGSKRNLMINEDTTKIQVYYDQNKGMVCAQIWGTWPGTPTNDGIQEFDSVMRVYKGYNLLEAQDEPLIKSNPFTGGIPFHLYSFKLPRGGGEYYFLFDFYQQQLLGKDRLGMPHRDWSGTFRSELWKIYLPLIFKPEPPTPPPPVNCPIWTIEGSAPGFSIPALAYKKGGNHYPTINYLYFGQTMSVRIKNNGAVSNLPVGGETTVYNGAGTVVAEYGRNGNFSIVGGQGPYGEDFFTFDSSFPWQGISCRASFTIWDPELVLNALEERLDVSRQEAIDLLDEYLNAVTTNTTNTTNTTATTATTLTQMDIWDWVNSIDISK